MPTTPQPADAGRWHVEHPYGEPGTYVADSTTTALVAKVYPADGRAWDQPHETTESRAALIAAAPDLLAALEWAMHHVENVFALANRHDSERPQLDAARAAIARATGQPGQAASGGAL